MCRSSDISNAGKKESKFIFDKAKLNVVVEDYSDTEYFAYAEYEGRNLSMGMALCDFEEDCQYWDFDVKSWEVDGIIGWLFSKEEKKEYIDAHIKGFIYQYEFICSSKY